MTKSADDTRTFRTELSSESRTFPLGLTIDPGFVHHRKIQALLGVGVMTSVDAAINGLPDLPEYVRVVRIDYIYRDVLLAWCQHFGVGTLGEAISAGNPHGYFCSTELLMAQILNERRATNRWQPSSTHHVKVRFEYNGICTGFHAWAAPRTGS